MKALGEDAGRRIVAARGERPFSSVADLARRAGITTSALESLAECGALAGLGLSRRAALWQVEAVGRSGALFAGNEQADAAGGESPLDEMTEAESLAADYRTAALSTSRHPMALRRPSLARAGILSAADLATVETGRRVKVAGQLIVRQRPGSAKGFFFMTLEDETGFANAIVTPAHFAAHRPLLVSAAALVVEGVLQRLDGTIAIRADRFAHVPESPARGVDGVGPGGLAPSSGGPREEGPLVVVPSRDFH